LIDRQREACPGKFLKRNILIVDVITLQKVSAKKFKVKHVPSGHPGISDTKPKNLRRGKKTNLLPVGHSDLPAERIITDRGESAVLLALNFEYL
jgi:hypothetical protein